MLTSTPLNAIREIFSKSSNIISRVLDDQLGWPLAKASFVKSSKPEGWMLMLLIDNRFMLGTEDDLRIYRLISSPFVG